jgi:poly(glycerol-phosphate) alpha-glucosyltransferase
LLKTLVRQSGNEDSVHFPGPHFGADKEAAYRAADGFILPSFSEGLPVAVLEAWAHGLPVVMTAACNLPEACRAKAAIVTESDAESIRDGLLTLFSMTDAECRAMGERGCRMVTERFSWPRIATDLRTVYDWVLGGGAPPGCVITD